MQAHGLSTSEDIASNSLSNSKCKSKSQAAQMYTDRLSRTEVSKVSMFLSCYEEFI